MSHFFAKAILGILQVSFLLAHSQAWSAPMIVNVLPCEVEKVDLPAGTYLVHAVDGCISGAGEPYQSTYVNNWVTIYSSDPADPANTFPQTLLFLGDRVDFFTDVDSACQRLYPDQAANDAEDQWLRNWGLSVHVFGCFQLLQDQAVYLQGGDNGYDCYFGEVAGSVTVQLDPILCNVCSPAELGCTPSPTPVVTPTDTPTDTPIVTLTPTNTACACCLLVLPTPRSTPTCNPASPCPSPEPQPSSQPTQAQTPVLVTCTFTPVPPTATNTFTVTGTPQTATLTVTGTPPTATVTGTPPTATPTSVCPGQGYHVLLNTYYQGTTPDGTRETWADDSLDNSNDTISQSGCFLTCLAMLRQTDPGTLNQDLTNAGAIGDDGLLTQDVAAAHFGWPDSQVRSASDEDIIAALQRGDYVIAHVSGHFVVVTGVTCDSNGNRRFTIQDPAGLTNNSFLDEYGTPDDIRTFGSSGTTTPGQ